MNQLNTYNENYKNKTPLDIVKFSLNEWGKDICIASSLGVEDQALTHMAVMLDPNVRIFVLDTGRLHPETYDVLSETQKKWNVQYDIYFPNNQDVEDMIQKKGINLFYDSVENRKKCCHVRKVAPLKRALKDAKAWITGLRRDQSITRNQLEIFEWDDTHQMIKINPLANWTDSQVWEYINQHDVPRNALHEKGYPSIGCAPCTRAIEPGENIRAGRWWWETPEQKECGLHIVDGKLVRKEKGRENK